MDTHMELMGNTAAVVTIGMCGAAGLHGLFGLRIAFLCSESMNPLDRSGHHALRVIGRAATTTWLQDTAIVAGALIVVATVAGKLNKFALDC